MNAPTTTQEMKYGRNITDCVMRLKYFPASSLSSTAHTICKNVLTHKNAIL